MMPLCSRLIPGDDGMARNTFALFRGGQIGGFHAFSARLKSLRELVFPDVLTRPLWRAVQNGFAPQALMTESGDAHRAVRNCPCHPKAGVEPDAGGSIMSTNSACSIAGWFQVNQKVAPVMGK